jgi:hypothetical protein
MRPQPSKRNRQLCVQAKLSGCFGQRFRCELNRTSAVLTANIAYCKPPSKHAFSWLSPPHASNSRFELATISCSLLGRPFPEPG